MGGSDGNGWLAANLGVGCIRMGLKCGEFTGVDVGKLILMLGYKLDIMEVLVPPCDVACRSIKF